MVNSPDCHSKKYSNSPSKVTIIILIFLNFLLSYPQLTVKKFPLLSMESTAWALEPQPKTTRINVPEEKRHLLFQLFKKKLFKHLKNENIKLQNRFFYTVRTQSKGFHRGIKLTMHGTAVIMWSILSTWRPFNRLGMACRLNQKSENFPDFYGNPPPFKVYTLGLNYQ